MATRRAILYTGNGYMEALQVEPPGGDLCFHHDLAGQDTGRHTNTDNLIDDCDDLKFAQNRNSPGLLKRTLSHWKSVFHRSKQVDTLSAFDNENELLCFETERQ